MVPTLWLWCMPLLFLPSLGLGRNTPFGVLELSDFIILPYVVFVLLGLRKTGHLLAEHTSELLILFCVWALMSTLSINIRYGYSTPYHVEFGILKLAKLALYGFAGVLSAKALTRPRMVTHYHWTLLVSGCIVGISLFAMAGEARILRDGEIPMAYKGNNGMSVLVSILACYLGGLVISGYGSRCWRRWAVVTLTVMGLGSALSGGRGGWLAAAAGMTYLVYRRGLTGRVLAATIAILAASLLAYNHLLEFRSEVNKTFSPDKGYMQQYNVGVMGVDEGERLYLWKTALPQIAASPLWGTGLYHRGGRSGIWVHGSHNFFLQMFLETGIPGGLLILLTFLNMWTQAGCVASRSRHYDLPVRSALIAAIVGALGGEYLYGGMGVFGLFAAYAPVGAISAPFRTQPRALARPYAKVLP